MKQLIGTALVVTLILAAAPVLAGDTFHALSRLPAAEATLTPLDDAQLATIEGGILIVDFCLGCANVAEIEQTNTAAVVNTFSLVGGGSNVIQTNVADVDQEIN